MTAQELPYDYDLFFAHADEDACVAQRLKALLLEADTCLRIFCPSVDLVLGDAREEATRSAMLRSQVFVALISEHFQRSRLLADDVVVAIRETSEDDRRRIIPVYLQAVDPPHGLSRLVSVRVGAGPGLEEAADQIARAVTMIQGRQRAHPPDAVKLDAERLWELINQRRSRREAGEDDFDIDEQIGHLKGSLRRGGVIRCGDVLGDRYELIEHIGDGGFARVLKAWDRGRQRAVAIKILHGRFAEDRTQRERFARGIRQMQGLVEAGVPGVARVLQEVAEDHGYHYCVLEYLAGLDLRQAVLDGRVRRSEIIPLIVELGASLHAAHQRKLIHRDVKPTNILLDSSGCLKLTDFDLVWSMDTSGGTRAGPMGTFIFSAPETLRSGDRVDVRADVFSLAMVTVFGLHGRDLPPEAFRSTNPFLESLDCRPAVRRELARALDWDVARRHESVAAFCRDLERAQLQETNTTTARSLDLERVRRKVSAELFGTDIDPVSVHARYQLIRRLGRGASGQVQEAYDTKLGRQVALKLVSDDRLEHIPEEVRKRLLAEARHLAMLSHPNVVQVFDVNVDVVPFFISMELIQGTNAADWIEEAHPSSEEILRVFRQAGKGLAAAHDRRIVHRDFKAQNVLVQRDPWRVCVTDFGLARLHAESGSGTGSCDDSGVWGGTLGYMAPEQHQRMVTTPRSDQFSFCAALYKALYGELPFSAVPSAGQAIALEPPNPPRVGSVPSWVLPVLQRGLSATPDARFSTMAELLGLLRR